MRSIGPYAFRILLGYPPKSLCIDSVIPLSVKFKIFIIKGTNPTLVQNEAGYV